MKDILNHFRWQDGLDIVILTFVIHRLYLSLRKKRALRMILAVLALPSGISVTHFYPPKMRVQLIANSDSNKK